MRRCARLRNRLRWVILTNVLKLARANIRCYSSCSYTTRDAVILKFCGGGEAVPEAISSGHELLVEFSTSPYGTFLQPTPVNGLHGFQLEVEVKLSNLICSCNCISTVTCRWSSWISKHRPLSNRSEIANFGYVERTGAFWRALYTPCPPTLRVFIICR